MPLTPADRLQIEQSIHTYCHVVDHGEPEEMRAVFTDDMEFSVAATGQVWSGIADFVSFIATRRATRDHLRHLIVNTVIREGESGVTSSAYLQIVKLDQGLPQMVKLTRYLDEWSYSGGAWRIRRRRMQD